MLSIYLHLSFFKIENEAILRDFHSFWTWQHQKRNIMRDFLNFLNLTTSQTKQVCEISSFSEIYNIKKMPFCETSFKHWKLSAGLTASSPCILRFSHSMSLKYCACREKVRPGHMKCCTCLAKHLSKPADLMLQNATPLRTSAPWPPNISDEHVSCTAPATDNASLQIFFKYPRPANVFSNCY